MTKDAEVRPVICVCTMDFQFRSICSFIDVMRQAPRYHRTNFVDMTLLPYARNSLVKMTYEAYPDFTHIIFIDDDMSGYLPEHLDALIAADVPIISGLVTTRRPPYQMVCSFAQMPPEEILQNIENQSVIQSDLIGMAFTCIKREVFDNTAEQLIEGKEVDILSSLAIDAIFKDSKKGTHAPQESIEKHFGTLDIEQIAKEIILNGEIQLTTEQRHEMQEQKRKRVIDFIVKNSMDPKTKAPHPRQRIELAISTADMR